MPQAKYIAIIGPDGCGKTTVADELATELIQRERTVSRYNFTFQIMPPISRLLGRKRITPLTGQKDAGMVAPLSGIHASLLACWYGIDHLLGHWILRRKNSNEFVIFARSYHDFFYQRAYLNLPLAIPEFFVKIGPKPDLMVALVRDAKMIFEQKPELRTEEIEEQYHRISMHLKRYCYFQNVDVNSGPRDAIDKIRSTLSP